MNCKIYETCPSARNCSIVTQAEFCAYHQYNYDPQAEPPKNKPIDFVLEDDQ